MRRLLPLLLLPPLILLLLLTLPSPDVPSSIPVAVPDLSALSNVPSSFPASPAVTSNSEPVT